MLWSFLDICYFLLWIACFFLFLINPLISHFKSWIACATVEGTYPFKKLISLDANSGSTLIQANCQPQFQFVIEYNELAYEYDIGAYQTLLKIHKQYKLPSVKYLKSIHLIDSGFVDDNLDIYFNDVKFASNFVRHCYDSTDPSDTHVSINKFLSNEELEIFKQLLTSNNLILDLKGYLSDKCGGWIQLKSYNLKITLSYE